MGAACIEQREDADRPELKWSEYKTLPRVDVVWTFGLLLCRKTKVKEV